MKERDPARFNSMSLGPPLFLIERKRGEWLDSVFSSAAEAEQAAKAAGLDPKTAVQPYPNPDYYCSIPKPMPKAWLAEIIRRGAMISKSALTDGAWYIGRCRSANTAQWDAKRDVFVHWREKFDRRFTETIRHPEDDDGFDLFWPVERIQPVLETEDLRGK